METGCIGADSAIVTITPVSGYIECQWTVTVVLTAAVDVAEDATVNVWRNAAVQVAGVASALDRDVDTEFRS